MCYSSPQKKICQDINFSKVIEKKTINGAEKLYSKVCLACSLKISLFYSLFFFRGVEGSPEDKKEKHGTRHQTK